MWWRAPFGTHHTPPPKENTVQVQEIKKGDRVRLTLEFTAIADVTPGSGYEPWVNVPLGEHEDPTRAGMGLPDTMSHFSLEVPLTHADVDVHVEKVEAGA